MGRTRSWRARARLSFHRSRCLTSTRRWDWLRFHSAHTRTTPHPPPSHSRKLTDREKSKASHPSLSTFAPISLDSLHGPWAQSRWEAVQQRHEALCLAAEVQASKAVLHAVARFIPHHRRHRQFKLKRTRHPAQTLKSHSPANKLDAASATPEVQGVGQFSSLHIACCRD